MAEIRSSGVLLGRFRQTTLGFLLGKIPRLVEWILLAKVYRSSSLTRLDSTISNPADDPRPWTKPHDSSSKSYEIFSARILRLQNYNTDVLFLKFAENSKCSGLIHNNNNNLFLLM